MMPTLLRRARINADSISSSSGVSITPPPVPSNSVPQPPLPVSSNATSVPQLPPTPVGSSRGTLSDGNYARKCRTLMTLLKDLKALGADSVFDLPKIAVIGNQSAGKSSLIEAVTGINVPRDSGTCTRCPMECSMSSAATSWSCTISLRFEGPREVDVISSASSSVASLPVSIERDAPTRSPARIPHGPTQPFGGPITDKSQVELWLRRAQGAVLSTDPDKSRWLTKSAEEIRQAIENEPGMHEFTEDTIVVDIQDPNATDLLFVDLPGIISNADSNSVGLIKNLVRKHIAGNNTLVLVTIPATDDIQLHEAMKLAKRADPSGERTIAVITKPDLLGEGQTGLQQMWKQIFENRNVGNNRHYLKHGYYCVQLPNDQDRERGRTTHTLSNYLEVNRPWSEFTDRGRFGVTNLVRDISTLLVQMIEANLPHLRAAIEGALRKCSERLSKLPAAVPHENAMASIMLLINAFLREIQTASFGETHKKLAQDCRKQYNKMRDEVEGTCPKFQRNKNGGGHIYNIQDVRTVIDDCTGWELPGVIPYDAYKTFITEFLEGWKTPVEKCFEGVHNSFSSFINNLSNNHFKGLPQLNKFVLLYIQQELQNRRSITETSIFKLLDVEAQPYFSQRKDFRAKQQEWMNAYWHEFYPYVEGTRYLESKEEIHVMATVRTYFQFAFERFADTLLLTQEHDLVQSLRPKLEETLLTEISKLNESGLKRLLDEDEDIRREREEQTNRKTRMLDIMNRLDTYGTV